MTRFKTTLCIAALALGATQAWADPALGTWLTPPDRKDLTSHIEIRACGAELCGKVVRAFDPTGKEVKTKNVGRELFWGMSPKGGGAYDNGTVRVPLLNVNADATMRLSGNSLKVKACKLGKCEEFTWTRVN